MNRQPKKANQDLTILTEDFEYLSVDDEALKNSPSARRGTLMNEELGTSPQKPSAGLRSALLTNKCRSSQALLYLNKKKQTRKLRPSNSLSKMVTRVPTAQIPSDCDNKSEIFYKEHLFQTFQSMKFIRNLQPISAALLRSKSMYLPKRTGYEDKKTLIFDLDETLVHCVDDLRSNPDTVLQISFPDGASVNAGINIRPYARECLVEASNHFEVIVFTASHRCYADVVLDYLDPNREYIHHRLYRENCVPVQGVLMKDLRIFLGRELKNMVIVDNAVYSFGMQLDNGIPIISWHDDPADKELFNLMDYLKVLAQVPDVRDVNRQTFRLKTFYEDYANEFMHKSGGPV